MNITQLILMFLQGLAVFNEVFNGFPQVFQAG
jgi:hypothetical protein